MIGIDCPDERTVQPFSAGRTGRRDANRAWLERRNTGIVAEMEKPHGWQNLADRSRPIAQRLRLVTDE
ncbi:hypothetical protein [Rhizobium leguminosarum]|uniref:hypothetical protein n=1 Tax=Rhizobium leguminosarum TaxID=384 RepID=UPI0028F40A29|nr:hypothetical protein [Rhizobium leguminosarum]